MFPELNNIVGTETGELSGKLALVTERGSDSSFILHHFLSAYIKQGLNVCLVLFNQSFSHYNIIGNKLSVSLNKAKEQGQLVVIEGLKDVGSGLMGNAMDSIDFSGDKNSCLKALFSKIKTAYDGLSSSKPTLIIVDELSVLLSIGIATSDVYFLTKYLKSLTGDEGSVLMTLHCANDDDADTLSKQIQHLSDLCVEVKGLQSGYCKDVHGEMAVITADNMGRRLCRRMQYRVLDKTVSFFAVGTSGAVL